MTDWVSGRRAAVATGDPTSRPGSHLDALGPAEGFNGHTAHKALNLGAPGPLGSNTGVAREGAAQVADVQIVIVHVSQSQALQRRDVTATTP